jgi:site-specific DNA-cytosine methylase
MRILIGCERSGVVREAFRKLGHNAWSCDTEPADDNSEYHFECDVFEVYQENWDLMICHPPCTYLTVAANKHFINNPERWQKRLDAVNFCYKLFNAQIPKIAMENPKGVLSSHIGQPDQYVEPYEFGHAVSKKTGLWLKGLPLLRPTNIVQAEYVIHAGKRYSPDHNKSRQKGVSRQVSRSITYQGIADAMADQWG